MKHFTKIISLLSICVIFALVGKIDRLTGAEQRCGHRWLEIDPNSEALDVSPLEICERATWGMDQMNRCGFSINEKLTIEVVEELKHPCGIPVAGKFDSVGFRVQMASPRQCRQLLSEESVLSKMDFQAFYGSVIVHEVIHAVLWKQLDDSGMKEASSIATEYIAYAFQIASLPQVDRDLILGEFLRGPPSDLSPFNSTALLINPHRFATNAYRHFMSRGDRCKFLRGIVSGEVVFDDLYQYE